MDAGIRAIISSMFEKPNVYSAYSEEECNNIIKKRNCSFLIVINEDGSQKNDLCRNIKHNHNGIKILLITETNKISLSEFKVDGILTSDCDEEEIKEAINSIIIGKTVYCNKVLNEMLDKETSHGNEDCDPTVLSRREREIIILVTQGLKSKEIADKLFISHHTVATHRKNIMRKLAVSNVSGLINYAIKSGLIN